MKTDNFLCRFSMTPLFPKPVPCMQSLDCQSTLNAIAQRDRTSPFDTIKFPTDIIKSLCLHLHSKWKQTICRCSITPLFPKQGFWYAILWLSFDMKNAIVQKDRTSLTGTIKFSTDIIKFLLLSPKENILRGWKRIVFFCQDNSGLIGVLDQLLTYFTPALSVAGQFCERR